MPVIAFADIPSTAITCDSPQMLNYLKSLGINENNIAFNILFPCENYNDLTITPEEFEKFIKLNPSILNNFSNAPSTSEERSVLCQIGKKIATIDYNGDIKLCGLMDFSIGNIRNDKFYNIWSKSTIIKTFSGLEEDFFMSASHVIIMANVVCVLLVI